MIRVTTSRRPISSPFWHGSEACACHADRMACVHIAASTDWTRGTCVLRWCDRHAVAHHTDAPKSGRHDRCWCGDAQTIRLMQRKHVEEYEFGPQFARKVITFVRFFLLTLALTNRLGLF
jgi:hypothetical protein